MSYLLDIPVRARALPVIEVQPPTLPVPYVAPAVPAVVEVPKAPRLPLAIRLDNALQPAWRLGVGIFFVSTAIPLAVCALGGWWSAMSLASPLGTIGIPGAMIMVRVLADVQRLRLRNR